MNSNTNINRIIMAINTFFFLLSFNSYSQHLNLQKNNFANSVNVTNYSINLDVTTLSSRQIKGFTSISLKPKLNGLQQLNFYLLCLQIDSIFVDGSRINSYTYNDTIINISLLNNYTVADIINATIFYHGTPKIDPSGWGGFSFSTDNNFAYNLGVGMESNPHSFGRVWFPCIDEFDERATYDCHIRVASNKYVVCGGVLDSISINSDATKTFHWKLTDSIPTYLASLAIGSYVCVRDTFFGTERIIPIGIYVRATDTTRTKQSFINLKTALAIFESCFGPYQWQRVGYVGIPFNGGAMEHATNIAYPLSAIDGTLTNELLYVHELSHSWFGNLITCKTEQDMWINEGWASYCEPLFVEMKYGINQSRANIHANHAEVLKTAHVSDGAYYPVGNLPHSVTYGTTAYKKGSDVVHTLRHYMGDSLFFNSVKQLLANNLFSSINSIELRDKLSAFSGRNLHDFFNAWVFSPGFPMFSVDSFKVIPSATLNKQVVVFLREQLKASSVLALDNIAEITFMNQNWNMFTARVHFTAPTDSVIVDVPFEPSIVMFDLYENIADATTDLYWTIKSPRNITYTDLSFKMNAINVSDSAFIRVQKCWIAPDSFLVNIPNVHLATKQHWKVEGVLPNSFYSKGSFMYQISNGYDSILHINSVDSIRLFYRNNKKSNWQIVNFTKAGNATNLTLTTDTLKLGEYCMGILKNNNITDIKLKRKNIKSDLKLIPNPTKHKITIEYNVSSHALLNIYSPLGILIDCIKLNANKKEIQWDPSPYEQGIFIVQLTNLNNEILRTEKLIYSK